NPVCVGGGGEVRAGGGGPGAGDRDRRPAGCSPGAAAGSRRPGPIARGAASVRLGRGVTFGRRRSARPGPGGRDGWSGPLGEGVSGRRVVILGGGMGGLATAWRLSSGPWRDRFESITVYQRGWRLGGKGASSRGNHGRIEEHGLHLLLGYYDSTFRLLREVYAELDRPRSDPGCPIKTWREAVAPAGDVGLAGSAGSGWDTFVTRFSTNDRIPGEPGAED